MISSTKIVAIRRGSVVLGSVVFVLAAGAYVQTIARIDPFESMKRVTKLIDPNLGARVENVRIESWDGERLVTRADIDRMDVRADKQNYAIFGVRNGVFFGKQEDLHFTSDRARWSVGAHKLEVPSGARLMTKDLDVVVPTFAFHSDTSVVNVPGHVVGKAYGGELDAMALQYNLDTGSFSAGPISWRGKTKFSFQESTQEPPRTWEIHGDHMAVDGDIHRYTNGYANDGSMILLADNIEWNRKTEIVVATGHVKYFSSKSNMICEKAVIERKIKKATLTGNVQMLLKAKEKQNSVSAEEGIPPYRPIVPEEIAKSRPQAPSAADKEQRKKLEDEIRSSKNIRDYPTICYAEKVVYWYKEGERKAEISGSPQARQEFPDGHWRQIWTNMAYYDGEGERLKMVSSGGAKDTRMINSLGDDAVAKWLDVSTKDGDENMNGEAIEGHFADYSEEIPREEKPKPVEKKNTPPPAKGTGTGGGNKGGGASGSGGR